MRVALGGCDDDVSLTLGPARHKGTEVFSIIVQGLCLCGHLGWQPPTILILCNSPQDQIILMASYIDPLDSLLNQDKVPMLCTEDLGLICFDLLSTSGPKGKCPKKSEARSIMS